MFVFFSWRKGKIVLTTCNNPKRGEPWKNCSGKKRTMVETGRFYKKAFIFICTWKNSSEPARIYFFAETSRSMFLDTTYTPGSNSYSYFFQYWNKTKATNLTKHRSETPLLHTLSQNVWSHLILLFYYS